MKNPFSNSQSAVNYGAGQAGQSSLLASQQGYHMSQAAQQAANQIGNMAHAYRINDEVRMQQLEQNIRQTVKDKEKVELLLTLLHADEDTLFRLKMFLG